MMKLPFAPKDCSAETLFPGAERIMNTYPPLGYSINRGGIGFDTNTEYWALANDPLDCERDKDGIIRSECLMCLVKFLDGSPVAVRYRQTDQFWESGSR